MKVSGTIPDGNRGNYVLPVKYAFLEGLKNGHKMMVSDLNRSLGRVESSYLVQNGQNDSPDDMEGLVSPRYQNALPNCSNLPYATFIPIILCLVWPPEPSGGPQRPK